MSYFFKNTRKFSLVFSALLLAITLTAGSFAVAANGIPAVNGQEFAEPQDDAVELAVLEDSLDLSGSGGDSLAEDSRLAIAPMSFNAPDNMKAAYLVQGEDFAKTKDRTAEELGKEAEAAAKSVIGSGLNTVIVKYDESFRDSVSPVLEKCVESGLYVYAVFEASQYASSGDLDALYKDAKDFASKNKLTGIIIDGYKTVDANVSYSDYLGSGASIGYENFKRQASDNIVKTVVRAVRAAAPETQAGLEANAGAEDFVRLGFADFVMIRAYGLDKGVNADELVAKWTGLAQKAGVTAYVIDEPGKVTTAAVDKPAQVEVTPLGTSTEKPAVVPVSTTPAPAADTSGDDEDYGDDIDDTNWEYADEIPLIKEVVPSGIVTAESESTIKIAAVVIKGSEVRATLNEETVYMESTGEVVDGDGRYELYTGYYTAPYSDDDDEQILGGVAVYANDGSREETFDSAYMATATTSTERVPIQITADQAKTYPAKTKDNIPIPSLYPLPKGAIDYAVGKAFSYRSPSTGEIYTYRVLESGVRVETKDMKTIKEGPKNNKIKGLSVTAGKDGYTYVTIDTAQRVTYSVAYNGSAFVITFNNTTSVPSSATVKSNSMFSKAAFSNKNRLTLTLGKANGFMGYKGYYDKSGNLVFQFNNPPSTIRNAKIAIDPGHGGKDKGAPTTSKTWTEDVLNYNIAKKLEKELKARGATVNLMNNNGIERFDRAAKAEKWGADILISVHNNSATNKSAQGTEVFYFYPFSRQLAVNSSAHVSKQLATTNRGAKLSYYGVTLSSQMASVLVECGFMSNASEFSKLTKSKNQDKIAKGIADAIEGAIKTARTGTPTTGSTTTTPASSSSAADEEEDEEDEDDSSSTIKLSQTDVTVGIGSTLQLTATAPKGSTVTWKTGKKSVATVDSNGLVTTLAAGNVSITATATDADGNTDSVSCTVRVKSDIPPTTTGIKSASTGISLSQATNASIYDDYLTIYPGNARQVEILSQNGQVIKNSDFTWSSSKTSIATVDANGVVTAKAVGTCTVTAKSGDYELTCEINVSRTKVATKGIKLDKSSITVIRATSQQLNPTISPSDATDRSVTWSSSNSKIASVDSNGIVTGKNVGTCTITAKTKSGGYKATVAVEVVKSAIEIDDISMRYETLEMKAGDSDVLTVDVYPENATNTSVAWKSSRTAVVSVDSNGNIQALKKGTATITAYSVKDSSIYAECTVTVFA